MENSDYKSRKNITGGKSAFAKKSLGQNFLKSEKALNQIVEAGDIHAGDIVIEIGPGEGALTSKILEKGAKLFAIEKDDRLIPILSEKYANEISSGALTLIHGDVVEFLNTNSETEDSIKKILKDSNKKETKGTGSAVKNSYKIIANIPYYITGLITRQIFEQEILPERVVLLVQKEVADRIIAYGDNGMQATANNQHGAKESLLSLSVKIFGTPKRIAIVPKGAFVPAPTVDSAIISIENIARKIPQSQEKFFFALLHAAFSHKRKRLAKNLETLHFEHFILEHFGNSKQGTDRINNKKIDKKNLNKAVIQKPSQEWEKILAKLDIDKNTRAEDLSVEKYIQLLNLLA